MWLHKYNVSPVYNVHLPIPKCLDLTGGGGGAAAAQEVKGQKAQLYIPTTLYLKFQVKLQALIMEKQDHKDFRAKTMFLHPKNT